MRLSTKVAYNTIVQFVGKLISTALGLVAIAIITRYLGQTGFGEYTTALTFISYFAILADLGLTLITVQLISQPGAKQNYILGNLLGLRLISALIILSLGPIVVLFFPYSAEIKMAVAISALSFFFIALNQIFVGLFQKNLRLDKVSIAEVSSRIVLVPAIFIAIKLNSGLAGIMIATLTSSIVSFLLHYFQARSFARLKIYFDFTFWKKIISRSWPLAITIIFNLIYLKTDTLLLSIIPRKSEIGMLAEVGIYGAAYKVIDVLITFPFMFAGIILPLLTARWAKKNIQEFKNILQKAFDIMMIIAIPLVIGTQLTAKELMVLVAGKEFSLSGPILQILIIAAGMIFVGIMFSHAIIAINKQKQIIWAYVFTAFSSVIAYLIVIPRYSYFGAAWVTIYSESFIALVALYLIYKYTGFFPKLLVLFKAIIASIIMAGGLYGLKTFEATNLFFIITVAIIIYFPTLYLLRAISPNDIKSLLNKN